MIATLIIWGIVLVTIGGIALERDPGPPSTLKIVDDRGKRTHVRSLDR